MTLLHKGLGYSERTAGLLFCQLVDMVKGQCASVACLATQRSSLLIHSSTSADGHVTAIC